MTFRPEDLISKPERGDRSVNTCFRMDHADLISDAIKQQLEFGTTDQIEVPYRTTTSGALLLIGGSLDNCEFGGRMVAPDGRVAWIMNRYWPGTEFNDAGGIDLDVAFSYMEQRFALADDWCRYYEDHREFASEDLLALIDLHLLVNKTTDLTLLNPEETLTQEQQLNEQCKALWTLFENDPESREINLQTGV